MSHFFDEDANGCPSQRVAGFPQMSQRSPLWRLQAYLCFEGHGELFPGVVAHVFNLNIQEEELSRSL